MMDPNICIGKGTYTRSNFDIFNALASRKTKIKFIGSEKIPLTWLETEMPYTYKGTSVAPSKSCKLELSKWYTHSFSSKEMIYKFVFISNISTKSPIVCHISQLQSHVLSCAHSYVICQPTQCVILCHLCLHFLQLFLSFWTLFLLLLLMRLK